MTQRDATRCDASTLELINQWVAEGQTSFLTNLADVNKIITVRNEYKQGWWVKNWELWSENKGPFLHWFFLSPVWFFEAVIVFNEPKAIRDFSTYRLYSQVPNKQVGWEKVQVGWKVNTFFLCLCLFLSVCYPTPTFSTLLVYLAPKSRVHLEHVKSFTWVL